MNRRRLAQGIRIRQELLKRADRWTTQPHWRGIAALQRELHGEDGTAAAGEGGDARLLEHMRADASSRFGNRERRAGSQAPDADAVLAQADFSIIAFAGPHFGGDVKYIWELNRHAELLRMSECYHLSGDCIGSTFPQLRHPAKWRRRGIDILVDEAPHQFLPDRFRGGPLT